jgi:tripartite-type tricarboxylate transporter receptor subunit TctC
MTAPRIRTLLLALALFGALGTPRSLAFPDRPVRIIVPYAPGGGNDTLARVLGRKLEDIWGKPVVVENKAGANTIIATEYVARQEPDGYNILMATTIFSVNPTLVGKLPYDTLLDFAPVVVAGIAPNVLVARPGLPVNSVKELLAYGQANPGKLTYGTRRSARRPTSPRNCSRSTAISMPSTCRIAAPVSRCWRSCRGRSTMPSTSSPRSNTSRPASSRAWR